MAEMDKLIEELIFGAGANPDSFEGELLGQMVATCLKLIKDRHTTGQLKLIMRTLKEIRYAYRVFNEYSQNSRRLSIFGSARTPENHPDYKAAKHFSELMYEHGWMCITGAAEGIMKAGHEGSKPESSFGLSIQLSHESGANTYISGDPKLVNFRYFFTRKLMFMSHSEAIGVFPGGLGTQDELFEILTLMQTGKSNIVPVVLMEGEKGDYWNCWLQYVKKNLLENGWISKEDLYFFYQAPTIEAGADHILQFYRRYHSSRFVGEQLVIRLKDPLESKDIEQLNRDFKDLIVDGELTQRGAFEVEDDHTDLPRLVFSFNRRRMGLLRHMIDVINRF